MSPSFIRYSKTELTRMAMQEPSLYLQHVLSHEWLDMMMKEEDRKVLILDFIENAPWQQWKVDEELGLLGNDNFKIIDYDTEERF